MKLFQRIVSDKVMCSVEFKITSITVNVDQPLILKLRWKRGPQADVSEPFEVNHNCNTYALNFTFMRTSNFYKTKTGYQSKVCNIELIYSSVGKEELTGSVEIDMSPLVGQG